VESAQFSEFVLLELIAVVPSSLTAKTPRMPPWVAVNGDETVMDHGTIDPDELLAPVKVIVDSFFVTFPAGSALDPLLGTR
jgi:hypothetical protein